MLGGVSARLLALLAVGLTTVACTVEPPKRAERPSRIDVGEQWRRSATWLFATTGSSSSPKAECVHVAEVLEAEQRCQGAMCKAAADLAWEWLDKCPKRAPERLEEMSTLQAALRDEADRRPSPCAEEFLELVDGESCDPANVTSRAQRWATSCAEAEAGPLSSVMLERTVERCAGAEARVRLDTRSCATLSTLLRKAASCTDEKTCEEAWPDVEAYRARCELDGQKPDVAMGILQLAVAFGAGRETQPLPVASTADRVGASEVPLALADGSGAVLGVCHRRVAELEPYLEARDRCAGGGSRLKVVRLFSKGEDGPELRVGSLLAPPSAEMVDRYPSLLVAGELERLGKAQLEKIKADFAAVLEGSGDAAAPKLLGLVAQHGRWLASSKPVRAELKGVDEQLIAIFEELAHAKGAAIDPSPADRRGVFQRAPAGTLLAGRRYLRALARHERALAPSHPGSSRRSGAPRARHRARAQAAQARSQDG